MRDEQPQRAAVDRHQLDIAYEQAVTTAKCLHRAHGIIAEVLVIDRVELQLVDEIAHIWRLDHGDATRLEQALDAEGKSVRVGNMGEDIVGVDDVGELAFRGKSLGKLLVEELN